ncbi:MAG TPA: N-acetyltransferase [Cycloclasticus sp.]|jgi:predicted N-acyltransferase|nr:N-acetyltransferase [Cycloclasticus sp.]HIL92394.1 N-acetyltransferase [Cycloclasticus sp.]
MNVKFLPHIADITANEWNTLFNTDYPFVQHAFLSALETSGCTQTSTGWTPQHILVYQNSLLIAAMPCFIKTHSYGEYVFDWAWANAYQQHGLSYYPKLLAAIPFTPATGSRLCFDPSIKTNEAKQHIISTIDQAISNKFTAQALSSQHLLFPDVELSDLLTQSGWKQRLGMQYHWFNRSYTSFDDFLSRFKSRKRKTVRKERQAIIDQNISINIALGDDINPALMQNFYRFYHITYLKRSGQHGYLNLAFFQLLLKHMRDNLVLICAHKDDILIGAALCFKDNTTLYGRYWGCEQEYEFLHFETCYYQGIDFCIKHGLQRFDPGAQSAHKIPRGFEPIKTYSNHKIMNAEFSKAINHFIDDECIQVTAHIKHLNTLLPFKLAQEPSNK